MFVVGDTVKVTKSDLWMRFANGGGKYLPQGTEGRVNEILNQDNFRVCKVKLEWEHLKEATWINFDHLEKIK